MFTIEQFNRDKKGFFKATDHEQEAGRITYTWAGPDKLIIDHTEVKQSFSGKGVGKELVMAVVNYARQEQIKIMPLCPFARHVFEKNEDLTDVLF